MSVKLYDILNKIYIEKKNPKEVGNKEERTMKEIANH